MTTNLECDWCDVPATELRVRRLMSLFGEARPEFVCGACFAKHFPAHSYTDLPLSDRRPRPTYEALLGFVEEVRDLRPDVISGRRRDPQDDVDDMIPAQVLWDLQADAETLIGKAVKP